MADVITDKYDFTLPEVGGSDDTWGDKLNGNWAKMETLLADSWAGGSASILGQTFYVHGTVPQLRIEETDQIDPAGRWRFIASGNEFRLDRALTAAWGTFETVWSFSTSAGPLFGLGNMIISSVAPQLRFEETDQTDPAGRFRFYATSGGLYCQKAVTAAWGSAENLWHYDAALNTVVFSKEVKLASATVSSGAPSFRFEETDQTDPAGRFRFLASSGGFYLQKALTVNMASFETIWNTDSSGQTDFLKPVVLTGGINGSPVIESSTPSLRFHETDATEPKGRWQLQASGTGGTFSLYNATATDWSANQTFWQCTTAPNSIAFGVPVNMNAAEFNSLVEIKASIAELRFTESDQTAPAGMYRLYGSGGSFLFQFADAADWSTQLSMWGCLAADIFKTYGLTQLASSRGAGTVELGYTTAAALIFNRTTSINYIKVTSGASLRVTDMASTAWATITSASGWTAGSDIALKKDVVPIPYGLDAVLALLPRQFRWKSDNRQDIGFIAQEVQGIIPEVVELMPGDPDTDPVTPSLLGLHKDNLIPVLVRAIQELTARVVLLEGAP